MKTACQRGCSNGCLHRATIKQLDDLRSRIWGDSTISRKDRRKRLSYCIMQARDEYNARLKRRNLLTNLGTRDKPLCFVIAGDEVCEKAFAFAIGMVTDGKRLNLWSSVVKDIIGEFELICLVALCLVLCLRIICIDILYRW